MTTTAETETETPSTSNNTTGGASTASSIPVPSLIGSLDDALARLSDDPSGHPPQAPTTEAENSLIRTYAPTHLETAFQELYSLLYPCLRPRRDANEGATTASAILMGPRGSGKSLLVERCLAACRHGGGEAPTAMPAPTAPTSVSRSRSTSTSIDASMQSLHSQESSQPSLPQSPLPSRNPSDQTPKNQVHFRKVVVNGILVRGNDVPAVIYEIMRQLSDMALHEPLSAPNQEEMLLSPAAKEFSDGDMTPMKGTADSDKHTPSRHQKRRRRQRQREQDEYLLRLRRSTFTSNMALLESTLQIAEVDRIPIVLVLDELEAFLSKGSSSGGSATSTTNSNHRQVLLYHLLDRVATPGSNLILIGLTSSFAALTQMEKRIKSRAEGTSKIVFVRPPSTYDQLLDIVLGDKLQCCPIQDDVRQLFSIKPHNDNEDKKGTDATTKLLRTRIVYTLEREFRMGKSVRWFSRVLSSALSLYRFECVLALDQRMTHSTTWSPPPTFSPQYLMEALTMMGATSLSDGPSTSATKQSSLSLVDEIAVDPRLQALLDLSQPQVALVLAARRILAREAHKEVEGAPLTLQRMTQELASFRKGSKGFDPSLLTSSANALLDRGVFVPSMDHSGGGPLHYNVSQSYQNLDPQYSLARLPLHLPVELERELLDALKRNLLDCSTALREWGRKTN